MSLFIIPVSSRTVAFSKFTTDVDTEFRTDIATEESTGYIQLIRGTLKAQQAYLQSLETSDMFTPAGNGLASDADHLEQKKKESKTDKKNKSHPAENVAAKALKGNVAALTGLHGKLHGDVPFAKREIAWGKLDAKDIDEIFSLFRNILIPLIGMSTITDIFERIAERRGWVDVPNSRFDNAEAWEKCDHNTKEEEKKTWNEIMKTLHEPFEVAIAAMDEGLQHAGLILELIPQPKTKKDVDIEAKGDQPTPGDPKFSEYLQQKMLDFYSKRGAILKAWAKQKGLSEDQFDSTKLPENDKDMTPNEAQHRRDQSQLYLILYLEHLLYSCGKAVGELVKFADKKVEEGTMKKNRLILPGQRRLK